MMKEPLTIAGEPLFAADDESAAIVLAFEGRARAEDFSGPRVLLLEGPPAAGVQRLARAIADPASSSAARDEEAATFEIGSGAVDIVTPAALGFSDAQEFGAMLAAAVQPEPGRFLILAGPVDLPPEIAGHVVRARLVAPAEYLSPVE